MSFVSRASSVIPTIAFIGVRISWLMFARNSLFARTFLRFCFRHLQFLHQLRQPVRIFLLRSPRRFQIIGVKLQLHFGARLCMNCPIWLPIESNMSNNSGSSFRISRLKNSITPITCSPERIGNANAA